MSFYGLSRADVSSLKFDGGSSQDFLNFRFRLSALLRTAGCDLSVISLGGTPSPLVPVPAQVVDEFHSAPVGTYVLDSPPEVVRRAGASGYVETSALSSPLSPQDEASPPVLSAPVEQAYNLRPRAPPLPTEVPPDDTPEGASPRTPQAPSRPTRTPALIYSSLPSPPASRTSLSAISADPAISAARPTHSRTKSFAILHEFLGICCGQQALSLVGGATDGHEAWSSLVAHYFGSPMAVTSRVNLELMQLSDKTFSDLTSLHEYVKVRWNTLRMVDHPSGLRESAVVELVVSLVSNQFPTVADYYVDNSPNLRELFEFLVSRNTHRPAGTIGKNVQTSQATTAFRASSTLPSVQRSSSSSSTANASSSGSQGSRNRKNNRPTIHCENCQRDTFHDASTCQSAPCIFCRDQNHGFPKCPGNKAPSKIAHARFAATVDEPDSSESVTLGPCYEFCVDSGANQHMCTDASLFTDIRPLSANQSLIEVGNRQRLRASGIGTVLLTVLDKDAKIELFVLRNVLLVPDMCGNLLSTYHIAFDSVGNPTGDLFIHDASPRITRANGASIPLLGRNKLLFLRGFESKNTAAKAYAAVANPEDLHRRLGHISYEGLRTLFGVNFSGKHPLINCADCMAAKSHRQPVPQQAAPRKLEPGNLVHTDISGPMEVASFNGSNYAIEFIDNATRFARIYLMKHKSDALLKLKEYVADMKRCGVPIGNGSVLQSDNDSVYMSKDFADYCGEIGIRQRTSAPYTQAQNGIAERHWRTIMESALAMLISARLPKSYWGAAVLHANFIRNRTPHRALRGKTPFHKLYKKKFEDYNQLKTFGCRAFVHIPEQLRKKWDPKSQSGIYVGNSESSKTFLVMLPTKRKVVESFHVDFDEKTMPSEETDVLSPVPRAENLDFLSIPLIEKLLPSSSSSSSPSGESSLSGESLLSGEPSPSGESESALDRERGDDSDFSTADVTINKSSMDDAEFSLPAQIQIQAHFAETLTAIATEIGEGGEPRSLKEALEGPDSAHWKKGIEEELKALDENETFQLVPRSDVPKGHRPLKSKFVFRLKRDVQKQTLRFKARLVALGFTQKKGVNYEEIFSPVTSYTSIRVLAALAARHKMFVHHLDVITAFLYSVLQEDIYMEVPELYPLNSKDDVVVKLKKCLYGLKQAPREWNATLTKKLLEAGFVQSKVDPCLLVKNGESENDRVLLLIWVDDMMIASRNQTAITEIKDILQKSFKITDLGELKNFVGIQFQIDPQNGIVRLAQNAYVKSILHDFQMENCNPVSTPMVPNSRVKREDGQPKLNDSLREKFHELVGKLLYLSCCTRPDIATAVSQLGSVVSAPSSDHWTAIMHVLRYLKKTINFEIRYSSTALQSNLVGFCDASFAEDNDDRKSRGGFAFLMNGAAVSWKSKKQTLVATSTAEAEYIALYGGAKEAFYLKQLLESMNEVVPTITLFEDNDACFSIANNLTCNEASKAIDVKLHYTREAIQKGTIKLQRAPSAEMTADIMTKILEKSKTEKHCATLFGFDKA